MLGEKTGAAQRNNPSLSRSSADNARVPTTTPRADAGDGNNGKTPMTTANIPPTTVTLPKGRAEDLARTRTKGHQAEGTSGPTGFRETTMRTSWDRMMIGL
jgi:hypothetical protein